MKINKYPKVMEVSIYKDFKDSLKRVVFMYKNGMYLAWAGAATLEEADSEVEVTPWPYARDITPEIDITGNAEHCMSGSESMSLKDQIHRIGLERIKNLAETEK